MRNELNIPKKKWFYGRIGFPRISRLVWHTQKETKNNPDKSEPIFSHLRAYSFVPQSSDPWRMILLLLGCWLRWSSCVDLEVDPLAVIESFGSDLSDEDALVKESGLLPFEHLLRRVGSVNLGRLLLIPAKLPSHLRRGEEQIGHVIVVFIYYLRRYDERSRDDQSCCCCACCFFSKDLVLRLKIVRKIDLDQVEKTLRSPFGEMTDWNCIHGQIFPFLAQNIGFGSFFGQKYKNLAACDNFPVNFSTDKLLFQQGSTIFFERSQFLAFNLL